MWEWLLKEIQRAVRALPLNVTGADRDDVVGNVSLLLCKNYALAKDIYENKKVGVIYQIAKREIYDIRSKMFFDSKMELSRYQRIIALCNNYNIEPKPDNAYKIAALMDKNNSTNFTISGIITLLTANTPLNSGYSRREESLELIKNV